MDTIQIQIHGKVIEPCILFCLNVIL